MQYSKKTVLAGYLYVALRKFAVFASTVFLHLLVFELRDRARRTDERTDMTRNAAYYDGRVIMHYGGCSKKYSIKFFVVFNRLVA